MVSTAYDLEVSRGTLYVVMYLSVFINGLANEEPHVKHKHKKTKESLLAIVSCSEA